MKKENIVLSIAFGLLAIAVIVNGFIYYFNAITFVIAGFFIILSVTMIFLEKILDKILDKIEEKYE